MSERLTLYFRIRRLDGSTMYRCLQTLEDRQLEQLAEAVPEEQMRRAEQRRLALVIAERVA